MQGEKLRGDRQHLYRALHEGPELPDRRLPLRVASGVEEGYAGAAFGEEIDGRGAIEAPLFEKAAPVCGPPGGHHEAPGSGEAVEGALATDKCGTVQLLQYKDTGEVVGDGAEGRETLAAGEDGGLAVADAPDVFPGKGGTAAAPLEGPAVEPGYAPLHDGALHLGAEGLAAAD